ncbi:GntR family transcriptional regulator [Agromyces ramosus]|uniref:GntR family transcriptional regulator n=1 Tax=Agromyces ramosus TaxID=33879 RepID=UPI0027D8EBD8|nr:GntR family transcriptional regulator [Agromyces ramosus]
MSALIRVDAHGGTTPAPYEQIRVQVIDAVRAGALVAGVRLPPVRTLATELGLAANTVARAYRELERDGVIETRGRNGSFVSATGDPTEQQAQLAASAYADRIAQLGLDAARALEIVQAALRPRG